MLDLTSNSPEWYTPPALVDKIFEVFEGSLVLDPFSNEETNKIIKADYIMSSDLLCGFTTGYLIDPKVAVYVNPPGDPRGVNVKRAWAKLYRECFAGNVLDGLFLSFNISALKTTQSGSVPSLLTYPTCIFRRRINFWKHGGGETGNTRDSAITYIPGIVNRVDKFIQVFESSGDIVQKISAS